MAERTRTRRRFSLGVFFSPQSIWYSHVYTQRWKPLPRAEARMLLRPLKQPWLTGHSATQTWPAARTVTQAHWCQTCLSIRRAAHVGFDTMHRRSPPQCFSSRFEPAERGWVFCHLVPRCWCQAPRGWLWEPSACCAVWSDCSWGEGGQHPKDATDATCFLRRTTAVAFCFFLLIQYLFSGNRNCLWPVTGRGFSVPCFLITGNGRRQVLVMEVLPPKSMFAQL